MRWCLVVAVCLAGCEKHREWERNESCLGNGVSAHLLSVNRRRVEHEVFRVGARFGMEPPADEVVLRVCNGSDRTLYAFRGGVDLREDADGKCTWVNGPGIEVAGHRAVVLNELIPADADWFGPPRIAVPWAEHARSGGLICGILYAD